MFKLLKKKEQDPLAQLLLASKSRLALAGFHAIRVHDPDVLRRIITAPPERLHRITPGETISLPEGVKIITYGNVCVSNTDLTLAGGATVVARISNDPMQDQYYYA